MTEGQGESGTDRSPDANPPDDFVQQVKDALENLYDLGYLQQHPLVHEYGLAAQPSAEIVGQRLRRELASAIEALNPGIGIPFHAPHARSYNLLRLRYIERMTVREAAHELGLSTRQAHRDLRQAEENVAAILWARRSGASRQEPRAVQLSSIQAEMARIELHPRPTVIQELLRRALGTVQRQADQRAIELHLEATPEPLTLSIDPLIAEQVLVNIVSSVVERAQPGDVTLTLSRDGGVTVLTIRFSPESGRVPVLDFIIAQLVERLGWAVVQERRDEWDYVVSLRMGEEGPAVLVIDDNEGLVSLLERYLTDQACRVIPATSAYEGLRLAQELVPSAIVLDIMMPEMHGWELLQRLRNHPKTQDIPVIVCSIIDNPELAYSLGASLFLPKPISREAILSALRQLDIV
ncbi:MAG: response regulator [Anaerolineae bacterium]|nr:response regulator [Anaerolineae bacterium]